MGARFDDLLKTLREGAGHNFVVGLSPGQCEWLVALLDPPEDPRPLPVQKCRFCPAPVVFTYDERGTLQILDQRAPVFRILRDGRARRVPLNAAKASHFATCSGLRKSNNRQRDEAAQLDDARREMGDERTGDDE